MTVSDLRTIYDYGCWANKKLFRVIEGLTPGQFTQTVAGSYGSLRNTLVHAMSAEWGWLGRCGGPARGPMLNPADFPTFESVTACWSTVEGYVREFLDSATEADLSRVVEYSIEGVASGALPVGELMQHAATHGVHHRGQVALLLRSLGVAPGNFDFLFYSMERRASAPPTASGRGPS